MRHLFRAEIGSEYVTPLQRESERELHQRSRERERAGERARARERERRRARERESERERGRERERESEREIIDNHEVTEGGERKVITRNSFWSLPSLCHVNRFVL